MWNRAGSPADVSLGSAPEGAEPKMEEPMALEFAICELRWERYERVSEHPHGREWLQFQAARGLAANTLLRPPTDGRSGFRVQMFSSTRKSWKSRTTVRCCCSVAFDSVVLVSRPSFRTLGAGSSVMLLM